ncbi:MAG: hypothetical protein ACFFDT_34045 [Candidatus Hodarchaeota archaeon]
MTVQLRLKLPRSKLKKTRLLLAREEIPLNIQVIHDDRGKNQSINVKKEVCRDIFNINLGRKRSSTNYASTQKNPTGYPHHLSVQRPYVATRKATPLMVSTTAKRILISKFIFIIL